MVPGESKSRGVEKVSKPMTGDGGPDWGSVQPAKMKVTRIIERKIKDLIYG
jgi:hypothetical protein